MNISSRVAAGQLQFIGQAVVGLMAGSLTERAPYYWERGRPRPHCEQKHEPGTTTWLQLFLD
jgi:hypothetical protein